MSPWGTAQSYASDILTVRLAAGSDPFTLTLKTASLDRPGNRTVLEEVMLVIVTVSLPAPLEVKEKMSGVPFRPTTAGVGDTPRANATPPVAFIMLLGGMVVAGAMVVVGSTVVAAVVVPADWGRGEEREYNASYEPPYTV